MTAATPAEPVRMSEKTTEHETSNRCTSWPSVWLCIILQFVVGVQTSIYYMSMWPYLHEMDKTAEMHFLGWTVAACSFGCSLANPLFGYWNEKTMSVTWPIVCGFMISAAGQCMYGLLPLVANNERWIMIGARFVTGFGAGSVSVLRAYVATAVLPKERVSAISNATAAWVLGISFGPAIQAMFIPLGDGWTLGRIVLDMYTIPAFFMAFVCVVSCFVVFVFMKEQYAGIINTAELDEKNIVIPECDQAPAMVCVWLWIVSCVLATNIEVMSTPLATAMFGWDDATSILNSGLIESITCVVSVLTNFLIGSTRIGQIDKRKQIVFGLTMFLVYQVINYPWPFYPGPLRFIPPGHSSADKGGCDWSFDWCETSVAVPFPIYVFAFIVLYGIAFPFVGSPSASLYSEILGPRPQGIMQGLYSFGGSSAQFVAPIVATFLFEHSGYQWIIVIQIVLLLVALFFVIFYYKRLVPLQLLSFPCFVKP